MIKYNIDEVEFEKDKILIKLSGEELSYIAMNGSLSIKLDDKIADSIAFHILSILEDKDRRKDLTK